MEGLGVVRPEVVGPVVGASEVTDAAEPPLGVVHDGQAGVPRARIVDDLPPVLSHLVNLEIIGHPGEARDGFEEQVLFPGMNGRGGGREMREMATLS